MSAHEIESVETAHRVIQIATGIGAIACALLARLMGFL